MKPGSRAGFYRNILQATWGRRAPIRSLLLVILVSGVVHEAKFSLATSRLTMQRCTTARPLRNLPRPGVTLLAALGRAGASHRERIWMAGRPAGTRTRM